MRLFVYGTLKKGFGNNRLLRDSKFLGEAELKDYNMYGYHVPIIIKGENTVKGEVYEITKETLNRTDHLEGYGMPYGYDRVEEEVEGFGKCFVYVQHSYNGYIPMEEAIISDGVFRRK